MRYAQVKFCLSHPKYQAANTHFSKLPQLSDDLLTMTLVTLL